MLSYDKAKLSEQLKRHEGYRDHPYFDSLGILTIGIGHALGHVGLPVPLQDAMLLKGVMDRPWPESVLQRLFEIDCAAHEAELEELAASMGVNLETLSDGRIRALLNMCFNMGPARLGQFKKMWAALARGDYAAAAREALDSRWSNQVGHRAFEVTDMLRGGE